MSDVHEILEAPKLLGVRKIELELESGLIIVDSFVINKVQVAAGTTAVPESTFNCVTDVCIEGTITQATGK